MSDLIGTYGNIADGEFVVFCSDESFSGYEDAGWWRSYLLCIEENDNIVTLESRNGDHTIEVARQGYSALGMPRHHIGDRLRVKKTGKEATVAKVNWHESREAFYYTLDYGNRVSKNWFFDGDVEGI